VKPCLTQYGRCYYRLLPADVGCSQHFKAATETLVATSEMTSKLAESRSQFDQLGFISLTVMSTKQLQILICFLYVTRLPLYLLCYVFHNLQFPYTDFVLLVVFIFLSLPVLSILTKCRVWYLRFSVLVISAPLCVFVCVSVFECLCCTCFYFISFKF